LVVFIFFLAPVFPRDYLCLFLGLTNLPARVFFVVSTVGRMPGTIALSLQGASTFDKNYMFFVVVTGLYILFAIFAYVARDPLYQWMARLSKKRHLRCAISESQFRRYKGQSMTSLLFDLCICLVYR